MINPQGDCDHHPWRTMPPLLCPVTMLLDLSRHSPLSRWFTMARMAFTSFTWAPTGSGNRQANCFWGAGARPSPCRWLTGRNSPRHSTNH